MHLLKFLFGMLVFALWYIISAAHDIGQCYQEKHGGLWLRIYKNDEFSLKVVSFTTGIYSMINAWLCPITPTRSSLTVHQNRQFVRLVDAPIPTNTPNTHPHPLTPSPPPAPPLLSVEIE